MAIVAIGTLGAPGKDNYKEVNYKFSDGQVIVSFYPLHALIQRKNLKFDKIILLLTVKARNESWEMLKVFLEEHINKGEREGQSQA